MGDAPAADYATAAWEDPEEEEEEDEEVVLGATVAALGLSNKPLY